MKTRVLLCHAHEVPGLLDGRQLVIISPVVPQPYLSDNKQHWMWDGKKCAAMWAITETPTLEGCSPFGVPGDQLCCKETWGLLHPTFEFVYRADKCCETAWNSPQTMKPEYSRLSLEVVSVKVKQLKELTAEEVCNAGTPFDSLSGMIWSGWPIEKRRANALHQHSLHWNRLYAKKGYPFAPEAWCWLAEVRRVTEKAK